MLCRQLHWGKQYDRQDSHSAHIHDSCSLHRTFYHSYDWPIGMDGTFPYDSVFVAGFTASNKLYGVLEMAAVSYGYAITTYVGQNLGAKKYQRIRKGVHSGTYMALLTSVVISGVMVLFGRNILSLFVSGEPEQIRQVLDIAYKYLFIMAIFLWVLYLLYVYRSAIQGLGNTLIPLASGIAEFVMRVSVALLLPKLIGEDGIFYAEICAWTSAAVLLFISYMIIIRKYKDSSELPAKGL